MDMITGEAILHLLVLHLFNQTNMIFGEYTNNMNPVEQIVEKLYTEKDAKNEELLALLQTDCCDAFLFARADEVRRSNYGDRVFVRGLIEFTNYCKNNCYYCGIRAGNTQAVRYRLTKEEILSCCSEGHALGMRTFVLQGGEDPFYTDDILCDIVSAIHSAFPDCAITLSVGEKPRESYQAYFDAGARRYLLRHETASDAHYQKLHPESMSLSARKKCLYTLKEIGFQTGAGFMVGSPFQTFEDLIADIRFLQALKPDMIGIGPYLTHKKTPFADYPNGSLTLTLRLLSILRLMFPYVLLPATTALGTIAPDGRERGLKAGANVVMPNLSPVRVRKLYELYENKICTGEESAQCRTCLDNRIRHAGYRMVSEVGDVLQH
jgi:biotin synthase